MKLPQLLRLNEKSPSSAPLKATGPLPGAGSGSENWTSNQKTSALFFFPNMWTMITIIKSDQRYHFLSTEPAATLQRQSGGACGVSAKLCDIPRPTELVWKELIQSIRKGCGSFLSSPFLFLEISTIRRFLGPITKLWEYFLEAFSVPSSFQLEYLY